jgi:energy-coupling factor transporter ATP-binding protein EcfA2
MKIRALRLAEVGPFSSPVELRGFSGGLDVFTGPNETGKSTLFMALETLLTERHTTTARGLQGLRPEAGGAPLIEAEIETGGRRVRLTKRFLAQRMAQLTDLGSGKIWHGADAEAEAEALLGGAEARVLRGLVWVAQGASFALPDKPDATLAAGIASLIEQEAADASGAGIVRQLEAAVRERLEMLVTVKQGRVRAGGDLDKAQRRSAEIIARLEAARMRATAAAVRQERRQALVEERTRIADPALMAAARERVEAAQKAVGEADKAREMLRVAIERASSRQLAHQQAVAALERHRRAADERRRLEASRAEGRQRLDEAGAYRIELAERLERGRRDLAEAELQAKAAHEELRVAHLKVARAAARREAAELERRLNEARAADARKLAAERRLCTLRVGVEDVESLRRLAARREALAERIAAESAGARFSYVAGAKARFVIGGQPLADGARILVDRRIEIEIAGVGSIVLEPGASTGVSSADERARCQEDIERLLERIGAADLAAAEAALTERYMHESIVAEEAARFGTLAPNGIQLLEHAFAQAQGLAGEDAEGAGAVDVTVVQHRVRDLEEALAVRRTAAGALERDAGSLDTSIARLEARLGADERRLEELAGELPGEDQSDAVSSVLERQVEVTAGALAEASREKSAWEAATPARSQYDALVAEQRRAKDALERSAARQVLLDRELAEIEGAMARDGEDGAGAEVAVLEEELEAARRRLADVQTDADALQLLASRLAQLQERHRDRILRPLVDRLEPLLGRLMPGARLVMDGPLLAVRLERPNRADPVLRLSGGTREQIATLVRIAYADLMVQRGVSLPLVLDDALGFSDDVRLEAMVDVLAEAARRHQVVVLSCHQRALDPLFGAHRASRLELVPWEGAEAAGLRGAGQAQRSRASDPASNPMR